MQKFENKPVDDWNTRAAPKVKALEWEKLHENFYRVYLIGDVNFRVETYNQETWICLYSVPGYCNTLVDGKFNSAEAAKAAAQSHYEKLILEALEQMICTPSPDLKAKTIFLCAVIFAQNHKWKMV